MSYIALTAARRRRKLSRHAEFRGDVEGSAGIQADAARANRYANARLVPVALASPSCKREIMCRQGIIDGLDTVIGTLV